ncbi:hypothetical protein P4S68_10395 [Pseudoalteromonas sp. Hal099]
MQSFEELNITMQYLSAAYFNEKSYILYCVLERIVRHLDNPFSVVEAAHEKRESVSR